ncbi:MAG: GAF domain-containing protein [Chloroflexi bacterium]|jgi:signal transduction histidine kinase|nr:GAF domain-containing protein [Chloroflexota bacterium]
MTEVNNQTGSVHLDEATSAAFRSTKELPLHTAALELVPSEDVRGLLLRISREMVSASSLDEILQMMVDAALQIAPSAEKCVIHLLNAEHTHLRARVCSQPSVIDGEISGIPADVGIAGRALLSRTTVCVDDTLSAADFVPLHSGPDLRSLLVAPLFVGETALGTLSLSSSQVAAFCTTDQQHVQTLAAQASVAIHQAHLLHEAVAERQLCEAIIESLTDGLIMLGPDGYILRMNPMVYDLLELRQESLSFPINPVNERACPARLRALLDPSGGSIVGPYEMEIDLPSGNSVSLRISPASLKNPADGSIRLIHDVTAERAAGKALALFTSQVAHELRTPLQHIVSFADLMSELDDLTPESYQHFTQHIRGETNRLERLVDDLVQLSRIETGHFALQMQRVRLDELVANTVNKLALRTQLKGLTLGFCNPHQALWVMADPLRLEQVLANLLENALKFVQPGGRIDVSIKQQGRHALVSVADTGPGIPPEDLPHLFEQFYQACQSDRRIGIGLGLYISREIMRALGGNIWAESQLGEGSVFTFRLPILLDKERPGH